MTRALQATAVARTGNAAANSLVDLASFTSSDATGEVGFSVAVSADTAVVGAWRTSSIGAAYVFVRSNNVWIQQAKLPPSELSGECALHGQHRIHVERRLIGRHDPTGQSDPMIARTAAGDLRFRRRMMTKVLRVICVLSAVVCTGTAAVDSLAELGRFTGTDKVANFGGSIAISADTVVVGASTAGNRGAVSVFVRSNASWTLQQKLTALDGAQFDNFGLAVAIDGDTLLVGAPSHNFSAGAVYVFTRADQVWTEQAELTPSDASNGNNFGWSVSLSGNLAAIGARSHAVLFKGKTQAAGAVYVFSRSSVLWREDATLTAPEPAAQDELGASVAVSGGMILGGAPGRLGQAGSAISFVILGGAWTFDEELAGSALSRFGSAVALDGNSAIIGIPGARQARVYVRSPQTWVLQANVDSPNFPAPSDSFGASVALRGPTAVVGAPAYNNGAGAAYVFDNSTGAWLAHATLTPSDSQPANRFGTSVAASDVVLVGAPSTSGGGEFFEFGPPPENVVLLSAPLGRRFNLSGSGCGRTGTFATPYSGDWTQCTVQWISPDVPSAGTRYTFLGWQDGSLQDPRTIVPPAGRTSYAADFRAEYELTIAAVPSSGGAVHGAGWYPAGSGAAVVAVPNPGFLFTGFTGGLTGSQTPQVAVMSAPKSVTASFISTPPAMLIGSIVAKSGAASQRQWTVSLTNTGPGIAYSAQIFMLTFVQTYGVPCTELPVRLTPAAFPSSAGTLNPGATVQTLTAFNFTGCPVNARFTVAIGYMSNGGASGGVIQLVNQVQ